MHEIKVHLEKRCISDFQAGNTTISIRFTKFTSITKLNIDSIISKLLKSLKKDELIYQLLYCIHELVSNAEKANIKRVVFAKNDLNIEDPDDYKKGMLLFKEIIERGDLKRLAENISTGQFVKIILKISKKFLIILIHNSERMNYYEEIRMFEKRSLAKNSSSLAELLLTINDKEEGSGLGLIVMLFMLKKMGMQDAFSFYNSENGAYASLLIPLDSLSQRR